MAFWRVSMRKCRDILRLSSFGLSNRKIAKSLSSSHSTVGECLKRAELAGITFEASQKLDDSALEKLLYPVVKNKPKQLPLPDWATVCKELKRKGVTLMLLWQEYLERSQQGYGYSRFCERYRSWEKKADVVMRQDHKAGEKTFIDFAGLPVEITDPQTGEVTEHPLFVACLGASSYTYAEVCRGEDLFSWVRAHVNMNNYFGGVSEIWVPDNLKSGVKKPDYYEPDINPTYHRISEYYGTAVIPAHVRKPKEKAKAENAVQQAERWILAVLRHRTFFSIEEANRAVWELLEKLNTRPFKKLPGSRKSMFESLDKPALKPLPEKDFQYAQYKKVKVNIDYHVEIEGHYYSVPYQLIHEYIEAWFNQKTVELCYKGKRLVTHMRSFRKGKHTTLKEHMPKSHQKYIKWTPSRILNWAKKTGPNTEKLAKGIMERKPHPEQGFRACLGILSLTGPYGTERVEAACRRSLYVGGYSSHSVKSILKTGLDKRPLPQPPKVIPFPQLHNNIRGAIYYNQSEENE